MADGSTATAPDFEVPTRGCLGGDGGDVADRLVAEDDWVLVAHDAPDGAVVLTHVGTADAGGLHAQQRVPGRELVGERELAHLHLLITHLHRASRAVVGRTVSRPGTRVG